MRPVPRKWAVPLLLVLTAGLVFALQTADSKSEALWDYEKMFSLDGVEMTPQEELNGWLEEQAQAAKKFYGEHEELFHQIAQAALKEDETALAEGLEEMNALGLGVYETYGEQELRFCYAATEFPTAIFCNVDIGYEGYGRGGYHYDLGDGWYIEADFDFMYGL